MKYIIDPLVLCHNWFFFVYVLCFYGCLRSIFCGFGAYYAFFFWSIWIWCFFFHPSSGPEFFFFWFAATLTRFMWMSENRDLSDKLLRYSLLSTYFHFSFYFAGTAFRSCLILQFFVVIFLFSAKNGGISRTGAMKVQPFFSFTNDTFKIGGKRKIMTWTTDWSYGR